MATLAAVCLLAVLWGFPSQHAGMCGHVNVDQYGQMFRIECDYTTRYVQSLGLVFAVSFGIGLLVYGIARLIGWVIGGFASTD